IEGSSFLDACSARSSRSLSMASVLSVSLSRLAGRAAGAAAAAGAGFEGAGAGGAEACAGGGADPTARSGALGAPSAGSEIPIFAPHRLQRTIRRLPRTFSSAICNCVLQLSQLNCIRRGTVLDLELWRKWNSSARFRSLEGLVARLVVVRAAEP